MRPMTSRDRIKRLLNREPYDRIPNGLGGCETAGLHNLAYKKLKRLLGVSDSKNRVCTFMNNAIFEPTVIDAMEGDLILLGSRMCPSRFWGPNADKEWKDLQIWGTTLQVAKAWKFRQDSDGAWWWDDWSKCPPGALYFDAPIPSKVGRSFDDGKQPSPSEFNPSHDLPEQLLVRLAEDVRFLYETTPYSIVCGEMIHDLQLQPGGTQNWWMRMVEEPDACHEFLDKACDAAISHIKQLHQAIGGYCDILQIAHDMGDSRGVTIGPELWRKIYKPHYRRLFSEWHKITGMKISLHCCGSIIDILDDLIECGFDIYNPIQLSANGMDPQELAEKFGDRLIFWGGALDSVLTSPHMPEEVIYDTVRHNVQVLGSKGGYIFAGVHNLPGDIPESHLRAMIRAWRDS